MKKISILFLLLFIAAAIHNVKAQDVDNYILFNMYQNRQDYTYYDYYGYNDLYYDYSGLSMISTPPNNPGGHGTGSDQPGGGAPLGSGVWILLGMGVAYCASRRQLRCLIRVR